MKIHPMFMDYKNCCFENVNIPKWIFRFNTIPIKIQVGLYVKIDKPIVGILHGNYKRTQNSWKSFEKEEFDQFLILKLSTKIQNKHSWYHYIDRLLDQQNKVESLEGNLNIFDIYLW
jgi:hypothetical protein